MGNSIIGKKLLMMVVSVEGRAVVMVEGYGSLDAEKRFFSF